MPKFPEGPITIVALIVLAAWLLVGLPLLYQPSGEHVHGEILGVKYGEWLLFLATMALFWATWKLVRGANETAEKQLRAYLNVALDDQTLASVVTGLEATCPIVIRNFGNTPAHDVILYCNIVPVDWPLKDGLPELIKDNPADNLKGSRTVLHPRQEMPGNVIGQEPINADEIRLLQTPGDRRLCMYGELSYRDVFAKTHTTKFRLISGKYGVLPARFTWCNDGNESD
jgi:hypothetical protein